MEPRLNVLVHKSTVSEHKLLCAQHGTRFTCIAVFRSPESHLVDLEGGQH